MRPSCFGFQTLTVHISVIVLNPGFPTFTLLANPLVLNLYQLKASNRLFIVEKGLFDRFVRVFTPLVVQIETFFLDIPIYHKHQLGMFIAVIV